VGSFKKQHQGYQIMSQQFFYKAMDDHGHMIQGQLTANNASDLEMRLERMGLDLIDYRTRKSSRFRLGKVTRLELITFCFHMEQLTRAGVPLIEGLSDLRDSLSQSRFREVISSLIESIEGGERFSEALDHFPDVFDRVFVSLIQTGEESGNLGAVFQHLTETLKWHDEIAAKTKKLLIYPAFMAVVIGGALFFLMIYLVPQLVRFITSLDKELPWYTHTLIYVSEIFVHYWYLILMAPVALVIALKLGMKVSYQLRYKIDWLKLRLWAVGNILEKISLARFSTFFALLYSSGITVLEGLQISKALAGNLVIETALERVREQIADGKGISDSFEYVHLFPPLVLRMVKIGETTGNLDAALANVSYFYNREVRDGIEKLQAIIEPAITIILGLILGWVVLAVFMPLYDIIANFKSQGYG